MNASYKNQVELLLDVLPFIQAEPCFALKGGTAINLFCRNMPRLSVDIDLTYLPIEPRDVFLANLTQVMQRLADKLMQKQYFVERKYLEKHIVKLIISNQQTTIKIEPNTILRGCVFPTETRELSENAQNIFLQSQKVNTLSIADLYAGKICAALDRQHPRDLFDIKLLFDHEGITPAIQQAFVIYVASSPRPMSELLSPNELNQEEIYSKEFVGMTEIPVSYAELHNTRKRLIQHIQGSLLPSEREFLLSIKFGEPDWKLIPIPHISQLPGIRWKIMNIQKMGSSAKKAAFDRLKGILGL